MTAMIGDSSREVLGGAVPSAPPLVGEAMRGRETEWQVVRDLLRRAQHERGGVLLVEGEQGVGKSLLLRESVREAAAYGFSLAVGTADELSQAVPFLALSRALGEPFVEMIDGNFDFDLFASPIWWINQIRVHLEERSAATPVLVCLDDVQWACPGTLAALRILPQQLKNRRIVWVLARSKASGRDAERLFSLLENDGATHVSLPPLDADEVAGLVTDAFGAPPDQDLRLLAEGTAGNPWLLAELIGGLREDDAVRITDGRVTLVSGRLPNRLHDVARNRLSGLSRQAEHLLRTSAILDASLRLEDLAEMLGVTSTGLWPAIEETMSAGITTFTESGFSFRHHLLRRAVADLIPAAFRRALHRQHAQSLLSRGEPWIMASRHLMQAADPTDPASLADLDSAVERTLKSAPQTAADMASHALVLTSPGDPTALVRAVAAVEALAAAGRLAEAERIACESLAKPLPRLAEARLRCALSSVLCSRGQAEEAAAEARLVLVQPELPEDLRDQATMAHLQALAGSDDKLVDDVLAGPDQHEDCVVVAALVGRATLAWDKGQVGDALEMLRDAARRATAVSPDARRVQPLLVLAAALIDLRQLEEAEAIIDAADTAALRVIPAQAAASILRARIRLAGGRLADAAAEGQRALAAAETLGADGYAAVARCVLAVIALREGDAASAAHHLAGEKALATGFAGRYARAETMLAQAQLSELRDGASAAMGWIRHACADLPARPGLLLGDPMTAAWLARGALAAGEGKLAATVARAAEEIAAANPGYPAVTASAAHSLGVAGKQPDRLAQAAAEHPDSWARASAAEDLGVLFAGRAGQSQAIECLTQAIYGYQEVGAVADTARVRHRLRGLGVRRRHWVQGTRRPTTGWDSLTNAERTASEFVAQGLSNQEIARRMYVSVHTVSFYMRQTFRKLNIGSRVDLARIVIEHGSTATKEG